MPLDELQSEQAGVVSRRQLLALGLRDPDIRRMLRRKDLARVHPGVFVDHTGVPTWPQRRPPQMRLEGAVLRVASVARDDATAVAVLADACRSRRTTAPRLAASIVGLSRLPRRAFLAAVLEDVAAGVQSVLEHRYLRDVERAHALPRGVRQRRIAEDGRATYHDVEHLGGLLVVELDGSFHDPAAARASDLDRDLATALRGGRTVRLGWQQVLDPCRTAHAVGRILGTVGWNGRVRPCSRCR